MFLEQERYPEASCHAGLENTKILRVQTHFVIRNATTKPNNAPTIT